MKVDVEKITAYELIAKENIDDLKSEGYIFKHKKSGARVVLMANDDDNKVFYIGFRTTPDDSTGVMHILEHSVLCGSRDFPVKDPFIELAKGSLNTFLNAMTYPDKTVYPVASCNDKDFQNLMHVYLDAVFYPQCMNTDMTFRQEGWHYELDNADDELTINGVVYNEMKGAFSSPDDVLERVVFNSLFPDTTYGFESGGDPKDIPSLTYEKYVETYKKYYHPSNSYIYLYGDMDMAEKLDFIDKKYLSDFDEIKVDSKVRQQKPFDAVADLKEEYSITESEPTQDNTYLTYNVALESNLDREEYIALQLLDYALCSAPGAVLKQKLIDEGIGKDVYSTWDNGVKQPFFSIVAKNSNESEKERFISLIEQTIKEIKDKGFDKDTLKAGLNAFEFRYREADFGSFPPGLAYGLQVLDSWLYDDAKPFIHIKQLDTFAALRKKIESDYFENLAVDYILNNKHKTYVTVVPSVGLSERNDEELRAKLNAYKSTLSKEEIDKIVQDTAELTAYQEEEDSLEALATIPVLSIGDIKKETGRLYNDYRDEGEIKVLYHPVDTRGIDYIRVCFDATKLPKDNMKFVGLLKNFLGLVNTEKYTYSQLANAIYINTGGIVPIVNIYTNVADYSKNKVSFEMKIKVLKGDIKKAFNLVEEILLNSKFDDEKRNYELLAEIKSHNQATMQSAGHQVAMGRTGTYFSKSAVLTDVISSMSQARFTEQLEADYEGHKEYLTRMLKETAKMLFAKENLSFDFAGDEDEYKEVVALGKELLNKLENAPVMGEAFEPVPEVKNEGFMSSSMVNYVCRGGNFRDKGLNYNGSLRVLKNIMSYDYLWNNIRVKGGAYGCMCSFTKTGDCFFVSYRDPNLAGTVDVFEQVADYLENYDTKERGMTQAVIGAISELDTPLTPATLALKSMSAYMTGMTEADYQRERDEVLACDVKAIRELAKYIRAALEDKYICVVGNEEMIKQEKDRFDNLENLLKA